VSDHVIPTVGDGFDGSPVVETAVRAIYLFSPGAEGGITRDQARGVLSLWTHDKELSPRERTAVLIRFPDIAVSALDDGAVHISTYDDRSGGIGATLTRAQAVAIHAELGRILDDNGEDDGEDGGDVFVVPLDDSNSGPGHHGEGWPLGTRVPDAAELEEFYRLGLGEGSDK
jgi:hypothetical protein